MEERSQLPAPEALLAHAGWLRQLAAGLVADPGAADDVVQDTWVAALRHPPAVDRPLEPWLARVARNFALRRRRGERRRAAHELATEPAREAPTPAQTVERLELQRTVVEAVLALEEPFRTTLVQRYFEGQTAAEIARTFGVPASTVRWREMRGLAELRERLDGRFGSRSAWCAVLAPLARRAGAGASAVPPLVATSSVFSTVLAMGAMKAAAVFLGVVVVTGVLWWSRAERGAPAGSTGLAAERVRADTAGAAATRTEEAPAFPPLGAREESAPAATSAPAAAPAETAAAPRTAAVEVRFVDADGAPWGGVRLAALDEGRPGVAWASAVQSAKDGRARLELRFPDLFDEDGPIA